MTTLAETFLAKHGVAVEINANLSRSKSILRAECYPWSERTIAELCPQNIKVGRALIEKIPEISVKLGGNPI